MSNVPKTVREATIGKVNLRLVQSPTGYAGIAFQGGKVSARVDGVDPDEVWQRLQAEAGKGGPNYIGFDGARERFLRIFKGGFDSPAYVNQERVYKVEARNRLLAELPLEDALKGTGTAASALRIFQATNLVSPFEKMRVQQVLSGKDGNVLLRGAARFALGEVEPGLAEMERALRPHEAAKWTIVTYLPFLWRPEACMYLKPTVTTEFASRVGHRFAHDYAPKLEPAVYASLLGLVDATEKEVANLKPADRIDVQSFIWVVGEYTAADEAAVPIHEDQPDAPVPAS